MNFLSLIPLLGNLLDKLVPDPKASADAKLELMRLAQSGELAQLNADTSLALAQLEVNKADAQGVDWMQRNWRPFMGWMCGFALSYSWIVQPMLAWASAINGWPVPPAIDTEQQLWIIGQMLGLAGARTLEKIKGKA